MAEQFGKRPSDPDDVFVAPPMAGDQLDEDPFRQAPGWPKVVGIISIVLASLGLLGGVCGVVAFVMAPTLQRMAQQQGQPAPPMPSGPIAAAHLGVSILLTVLLLIAGILTVARKHTGRVLHLVWAPLSILVGAFGFYLQAQMYAKQSQAAVAAGGSTGLIIGYACGGLFMIWPIFCLIWFGLVKKQPHDFTGGITEPAA